MIIELAGHAVTLHRKRIKNVNLRITSDGQITVSAPWGCSHSFIETYLQSKQAWILKHSQGLQKRQLTLWESEDRFAYLGESLAFQIKTGTTLRGFNLNQAQATLEYGIHPEEKVPADTRALLLGWCKEEMSKYAAPMMHRWEKIIGVDVADWYIRTMKTRWGSCNTVKHRIGLNLYLIQKPLICLEYVIVHELVHLLEPSHNARFYKLLTQFFPNWTQAKGLLRKG